MRKLFGVKINHILWICYFACLTQITFLQFWGNVDTFLERINRLKMNRMQGIYNINLVPLKDVIHVFQYQIHVRMIVLALNFILFIPFGVRIHKLQPQRACLLAILFIVIKELVQYVFCLGVFDVNDIIINLSGVLCGWIVAKRCQ